MVHYLFLPDDTHTFTSLPEVPRLLDGRSSNAMSSRFFFTAAAALGRAYNVRTMDLRRPPPHESAMNSASAETPSSLLVKTFHLSPPLTPPSIYSSNPNLILSGFSYTAARIDVSVTVATLL